MLLSRSIHAVAALRGPARCCIANRWLAGLPQEAGPSVERSLHDSMGKVTQAALQEMREAGTLKQERVLTSPQGPWINVQGRSEPVLNFCASPPGAAARSNHLAAGQ